MRARPHVDRQKLQLLRSEYRERKHLSSLLISYNDFKAREKVVVSQKRRLTERVVYPPDEFSGVLWEVKVFARANVILSVSE